MLPMPQNKACPVPPVLPTAAQDVPTAVPPHQDQSLQVTAEENKRMHPGEVTSGRKLFLSSSRFKDTFGITSVIQDCVAFLARPMDLVWIVQIYSPKTN